MITVHAGTVTAETSTLSAVFENGRLTSLSRRSDGRDFISAAHADAAALELVYAGGEVVPLGGAPGDSVSCHSLGAHRAEIRLEAWNGDGVIAISEDGETGDLIVEPSGYASRKGLVGCRWMISGMEGGSELVAPLFQGVRLPLDDPLIREKRWKWPHMWEAGLAIIAAERGGFWVHCRDTDYRYKALYTGGGEGRQQIGLETHSYGPLHESRAAGGLAWRINVYDGDWKTPAATYRDWLFEHSRPGDVPRPKWIDDLAFAVSWCPCQVEILDCLATRLDPAKVLLHIPHWRSDGYDQNHPTFRASAGGCAFIERAKEMGFRTMPHMNSIDMDPTHPVYPYVRDFEYRELESGRVQGWTYHEGKILPVPESNAARLRHQDKNAMVKIHPGLSMWRSILAENVKAAVDDLGLDTVFLDVTLNTWNLENCLVENMTTTEGMNRLVREIAALGDGLAVGGEGRNEITMQGESLGQVHLFESWHESIPGLETTGACALNEFLFGKYCRSFGYSRLSGADADEVTRMRTHVALGAMPTVTISSAETIANPNVAVAEMLKTAGAG